MNVELYARGELENEELERFVNCRAELALRPLRDRFDSVSVFVRRRGASETGKDIRCLVVIRSGTRADVVVERSSTNLYVAIHLAIDEAGWALAQSCAHQQDELLNRQIEALCTASAPTVGEAKLAASRAA